MLKQKSSTSFYEKGWLKSRKVTCDTSRKKGPSTSDRGGGKSTSEKDSKNFEGEGKGALAVKGLALQMKVGNGFFLSERNRDKARLVTCTKRNYRRKVSRAT